MSSPRMARISDSPSFSKSRPSNNISPPTMRPGGATSLMIESAVTDLPQPDSPTRLNVSPRSSVNETSSTDRTSPRLVEKNVFRLRTSRRPIHGKEYYKFQEKGFGRGWTRIFGNWMGGRRNEHEAHAHDQEKD